LWVEFTNEKKLQSKLKDWNCMEFYLHKERSDSRQICFRARRGVRELGLPASKELEQQTELGPLEGFHGLA
jgi:hypothetical protein